MYTNRSEINEKLGASVTTTIITLNSFLGSINLFTVYLEKLYDSLLGTRLASYMKYKIGKIIIYIDNKILIRTINNLSSKLGQHMMQKIRKKIEKQKKDDYIIELY